MAVVPAGRPASGNALLVALCLLASALCGGCSIVGADRGGRHRAHHAPQQPDVYVSQLETASSPRNCPNCRPGAGDAKVEPDRLRLEVIKKQILSKLGLRHKPNVTHVLPREVIERVYRTIAGEREEVPQEEAFVAAAAGPATAGGLEAVDADDYYGRTSEIIAFAEQGKGRRLSGVRSVRAKS